MAKFRNLSEAIRGIIGEQERYPTFQQGTPIAAQTGDIGSFIDPEKIQTATLTNKFRWGYSIWGIDSITADTEPPS